jgi:hypothetical protein
MTDDPIELAIAAALEAQQATVAATITDSDRAAAAIDFMRRTHRCIRRPGWFNEPPDMLARLNALRALPGGAAAVDKLMASLDAQDAADAPAPTATELAAAEATIRRAHGSAPPRTATTAADRQATIDSLLVDQYPHLM